MEVRAMPGLEHEPFAEAWFREVDDDAWHEASAQARALGKTGLEVWTTTETPAVVAFLEPRGYDEVRRYVISQLDVATAPDFGPPVYEMTTLAERPELLHRLYEIALESYPDQPGRAGSQIGDFEHWRGWSVDPHPPERCFIALRSAEVLGYGYLAEEDGVLTHGFAAVGRAHRGRGVAGAIKRAQVAWAQANGVPALRTATETRLAQMRALNTRFGYRPLYEEIVLRGPLGSAGGELR
jgi:GNAT superfamily N-acetyltransferase